MRPEPKILKILVSGSLELLEAPLQQRVSVQVQLSPLGPAPERLFRRQGSPQGLRPRGLETLLPLVWD